MMLPLLPLLGGTTIVELLCEVPKTPREDALLSYNCYRYVRICVMKSINSLLFKIKTNDWGLILTVLLKRIDFMN